MVPFEYRGKRTLSRDRLIPIVRAICAERTKQEIMDTFERAGLPFAPIAKPHELFDDAHLTESGGLLDLTLPGGKASKLPALPFEMAGRRFGVHHDIPGIGEDGEGILEELGYDAKAIASMKSNGVIEVS